MALPLTHEYGIKLAALLLGLFFAWLSIFVNLVRWLIVGNKFWRVQNHQIPPPCLEDPKYGQHAFVQLEDIKMHYVEKGDRRKPLMLFLHGFPEFWFSWRHQMVQFSATHWVVAVDMRGYGETSKPSWRSDYRVELLEKDICQFVRALGKENCVLVAHDWGGIVAWGVAARNPELIDKLIIMNAPHPENFRFKLRTSIVQFVKSWYASFFQVPFIPELSIGFNDMEIFDRIFLDENKKLTLTHDEMEAFKYTFAKKGAWTGPMNYYRQNIPMFLIKDRSVKYPKIHSSPTLIIWGEDDIALSQDFPKLAQRHVTNLTIKFIPKGSHFIQQDKPQIVNSLMREFLNVS